MKINYPSTRQSDQVDDYHGTPVADPYRWLEDTDSPETREWIEAQNAITFPFLEKIPQREQIRDHLTELWNFARASAPVKRRNRYFQLRNSGLQNQDVLYVMDALDSEARVLLDPNALSTDGTVALTNWTISEDGKLLAYSTSASGSDWLTWHLRDVDSLADLPDVIDWSKFSGAAWLHDGSGFFYSRYDPPEEGKAYLESNYNQKLFLHRIGAPQAQDELIYQRADHKDWGFGATVSEDGRYLILNVWVGTDQRNRVFYQDLSTRGEIVELIPDLEANYSFVGNDEATFYFRTDLNAPRGRLIAIDTLQPAHENWKTLIAESDYVLEGVEIVHDAFVALYQHDAYHQIKLFDLTGMPIGEITLPALGSILSLTGRRADSELFYTFNSFVHPPTVYRYDFKSSQSTIVFTSSIPFDLAPYMTEQVFVASKDGTRVPMFVTYRKDLVRDGTHPTLLYGYGGFNISMNPSYAISRLIWLEMGGVLAVANLRGGGEYGETWHQAGMIHHKQNVFDDFIACAEFLIDERFTSSKKLAIQGGSNGGLLVGACMTQCPELFGAVHAEVGVMDMLRFQKFTIGWAWVSDYGSSDDPDQFKTLYAYSPLHRLKAGTYYPATLITTGDHDDRVVPGHSFKFAAALQAAQGCDNPALIRIQTKAGHGMGKPTKMLIEEQADIWSFFVATLKG